MRLLDRGLHDIAVGGTVFKVRQFNWGAECNWTSFLLRGRSQLVGSSKDGLTIQTGTEVKWITPADQSRLIETIASSVVEIGIIDGYEDLFTQAPEGAQEGSGNIALPAKRPGMIRDLLEMMSYVDLVNLGTKIAELSDINKEQEQDSGGSSSSEK